MVIFTCYLQLWYYFFFFYARLKQRRIWKALNLISSSIVVGITNSDIFNSVSLWSTEYSILLQESLFYEESWSGIYL